MGYVLLKLKNGVSILTLSSKKANSSNSIVFIKKTHIHLNTFWPEGKLIPIIRGILVFIENTNKKGNEIEYPRLKF